MPPFLGLENRIPGVELEVMNRTDAERTEAVTVASAESTGDDRRESAIPEIETIASAANLGARDSNSGPVRLSIGILAYNEETSIADTIESLVSQSVVMQTPPGWEVEIICVPNGCRDKTAEVAAESLEALQDNSRQSRVAGRVEVIQRPSKHNAWNEFVHRLSRADATHLVLMDGDVKLVGAHTIELMIRRLLDSPSAYVCGARTIKHIEQAKSPRKTLRGRLSTMASRIRTNDNEQAGEAGFAGCLYACPAIACRRLVLPEVLVGEDSFLRAVWSTDFFTTEVGASDRRRVVAESRAAVMFEAYLRPTSVLKNLRRRMVGLTINSMVYDELWSRSSVEADAGALLMRWNAEDPGWDRRLVENRIAARGRWVIPGGCFTRWAVSKQGLWKWFHRMRGLPTSRQIAMLPGACIGTCLHAYACIAANRLIRNRQTDRLWFTTRTQLGASAREADHGERGRVGETVLCSRAERRS